MKISKLFVFLLILVISVCSFASCSGEFKDGYGGYSGSYGGSADKGASVGGSVSDVTGDSSMPDGGAAEGGDEGTEAGEDKSDDNFIYTPGLITAGAWNDNDNFQAWKKLFEQGEGANGKFFSYSGENSWGLSSYDRFKVNVKNGDNPVAGAEVIAYDKDGNTLFSAVSDANGDAYLFVKGEGSIKVTSGEYFYEGAFESFPEELSVNLEGSVAKKNVIDIMFVVDVTGSMGDELNYLKAELADVIGRVCANNQSAKINLALLFYRDEDDKEQFKYFDFTDVTTTGGLSEMQAAIESQFADGGGDYPESVDEALMLAMSKQWSTGATTKLIFHVLDAPPHSTKADEENYKAALMAAAEKGIRICPILCSGSDYLTEYLCRQAAVYTGGTFIFVTDDSGIGNSHHDPDLPNVTIEALNSLMVRLINGYHSGEFERPVYWKDEAKQ